jgi:hypothetical protein
MAVAHIGGVGHVDRRLHRIVEALEARRRSGRSRQLEQPPLGILDLVAGDMSTGAS